jgi:hypothetical protein
MSQGTEKLETARLAYRQKVLMVNNNASSEWLKSMV